MQLRAFSVSLCIYEMVTSRSSRLHLSGNCSLDNDDGSLCPNHSQVNAIYGIEFD